MGAASKEVGPHFKKIFEFIRLNNGRHNKLFPGKFKGLSKAGLFSALSSNSETQARMLQTISYLVEFIEIWGDGPPFAAEAS